MKLLIMHPTTNSENYGEVLLKTLNQLFEYDSTLYVKEKLRMVFSDGTSLEFLCPVPPTPQPSGAGEEKRTYLRDVLDKIKKYAPLLTAVESPVWHKHEYIVKQHFFSPHEYGGVVGWDYEPTNVMDFGSEKLEGTIRVEKKRRFWRRDSITASYVDE